MINHSLLLIFHHNASDFIQNYCWRNISWEFLNSIIDKIREMDYERGKKMVKVVP